MGWSWYLQPFAFLLPLPGVPNRRHPFGRRRSQTKYPGASTPPVDNRILSGAQRESASRWALQQRRPRGLLPGITRANSCTWPPCDAARRYSVGIGDQVFCIAARDHVRRWSLGTSINTRCFEWCSHTESASLQVSIGDVARGLQSRKGDRAASNVFPVPRQTNECGSKSAKA